MTKGTKIAIVAILLLGAAIAIPVGRAVLPVLRKVRQQMAAKSANAEPETKDFVAFGRQTIIIMNPSKKDWGYTTIVVNDKYTAHIPDLEKGMQFEIFFKQLQGTNRIFDPKAEHVETVKIEPEGLPAIHWTPLTPQQ
jgi:hypothetical protein